MKTCEEIFSDLMLTDLFQKTTVMCGPTPRDMAQTFTRVLDDLTAFAVALDQ
jgi:hypothetical protein